MKFFLLAAVLLASSIVTGAQARDTNQTAIDICMRSVSDEVRFEQPGASRIGSDNPKVKKISGSEAGVSGAGQFNSGSGSVRNFYYRCTYNVKTGRAYGVDIKVKDDSPQKLSKTDVGVAVGALVVGAIVDGLAKKKKKHPKQTDVGGMAGREPDNGTWSPASGVLCDDSQSACYLNGNFSA